MGLVGKEEQPGPILSLVGVCRLTRSFSCQNPQQRAIKGDLKPSDDLAKVKTIKEKDKEQGFSSQQDDTPIKIPDEQVVALKDGQIVKDGNW